MKKLVLPSIIAIMATGCASTGQLNDQEIMSRYESLSRLSESIKNVETTGTQTLSPTFYEKANKAYMEAMKMAKEANPKADKKALVGIAALNKAKKSAAEAKVELDMVLAAKAKAEAVGAQTLMPVAYKEANESLEKLAKAMEMDKLKMVREDRGEVAKMYKNLELKALKKDTVDMAQKSIDHAKEMRAKKYAPKTFSQAEEEMRLALNILEVNRGDRQEAENYAERARWWAERSMAITDMVKTFEQGDYTNEDIVLWHQEQVTSVMSSVDNALPLNMENRLLMTHVRSELDDLVEAKKSLMSENKHLMAEKSDLESMGMQEKQAMAAQLSKTKAKAEESDRKFEFIQSLFEEKEAIVFRQKEDVLLRTQGFEFVSGKSEIDSSNFALLQKIIRAIDEYPSSEIVVSGHTDAQGDATYNQKLSEDRAKKVADFLVKVGHIDASRIQFKGFGESKPVASNETDTGRSENRRVEITLIN